MEELLTKPCTVLSDHSNVGACHRSAIVDDETKMFVRLSSLLLEKLVILKEFYVNYDLVLVGHLVLQGA